MCFSYGYSQDEAKGLSIGVSLYPNISNGFADKNNTDSEYYVGLESTKFSYSAGISLVYQFENQLGISSGINFMETGDKSLNYEPDAMRGFLYERHYHFKELFIELPINVSKTFGQHWQIKAGSSLLFNLMHKRRIDIPAAEGSYNYAPDAIENSKFGVTCNLGFAYLINISDSQRLEIGPFAQYNFISPFDSHWYIDHYPARSIGSVGLQVNWFLGMKR